MGDIKSDLHELIHNKRVQTTYQYLVFKKLLWKMMGKTKNVIDYSRIISRDTDFIAESETTHYE